MRITNITGAQIFEDVQVLLLLTQSHCWISGPRHEDLKNGMRDPSRFGGFKSNFLVTFSSKMTSFKINWVPKSKTSSAFYCNFVCFKSQKGKKYAYFLPIGKKYAFSPLFLSPLNLFFPQPVILHIFALPWGGGVNQKNIHPCFRGHSILDSKKRSILFWYYIYNSNYL